MSRSTIATMDRPRRQNKGLLRAIKKHWQYYIFLIPAVAFFVVFSYLPMYGVQIAFREFSARLGFWGSPWVGFTHFERFFNSYYFSTLLRNTVTISLYSLAVGFPLPIILALALNEIKNGKFKRITQTVTYAPYFISVVVMCGMVISFLSPTTGIINKAIMALGHEPIAFLNSEKLFSTIFVLSGVWQGAGWGSIIYLASLAGVNMELHEAALIDGAGRISRIIHINIPHILPTMTIMLILAAGGILSVGHEKILLLQNALNAGTSEVISTYVYKVGLINAQYSFSTAVGLFNSVVNLILLIIVNLFASKVGETALW